MVSLVRYWLQKDSKNNAKQDRKNQIRAKYSGWWLCSDRAQFSKSTTGKMAKNSTNFYLITPRSKLFASVD